MMKYIRSFRLRTLPLSVSGIIFGTAYVQTAGDGFHVNVWIFVLCLLTAVLLQIVTNLSNELGDYLKGTDNEERQGPVLGLQTGEISLKGMKRCIVVMVILSILSGLGMIYLSFGSFISKEALVFALLGVLAIVAATTYTLGKNAYGYKGWGDVSVFLFFGCATVGGSFYLQTHQLSWELLLPCSVVGFASVAVLNINNMRDMENDRRSGKITLAIRLGKMGSRIYHVLIILALCGSAFCMGFKGFVFFAPLYLGHLYFVFQRNGRALDKQLPFISLLTLLMSIVYFVFPM